MLRKRTFALLLLAAMLLTCLAGCGSNSSTPAQSAGTPVESNDTAAAPSDESAADTTGDESAAAATGDEFTAANLSKFNNESLMAKDYDNSVKVDKLTYIADSDITSLIPWDVRTLTPGIAYEVYEMLYGMTTDGEYYPILADATRGDYMPGMDHEAGSADYTIYIYDYITDSAGNKVTAEDVKFSFDMARDGGFESGWGAFKSEEVIDETTIVLHCDHELTKMGELQNIICRTYIFTKAAYENSPSGLSNDACGTGPYVVSKFVPSTELTVTRRDDYWQTNEELKQQIQQANVGTITMTILHEPTQQLIGLETGTIDLAEKFGFDSLVQLRTDGYADKFNTYSSMNNLVVFAYCNCDSASLCSNVALRKAVLMAIDNEALAAFVGNGMAPAYALGNNFYADYDPAWEGKYSLYQAPNADTIADLLKEANYNGETLELLTATYCGEYAEVIQSLLAQYGININLNIMDGGSSISMKADPNEWDIFYGFMGADDYVVNLWSHMLDADGRSNGMTENFINDQAFQDLLHACMTEETHTVENLEAFQQYVDDNAYAKGMCINNSILVYPGNIQTVFKTDKGYIVPGATCFGQ